VQATVERHAPGFTSRIIGRRVQGPTELCQADADLDGGTAAFRPMSGLGSADTPIDRLFLAGTSARPGGAVPGAPGANAARAALTRAGVGGARYRTLVRRALGQAHG
jgi:phytoene dehydrogenase-like protein